MTTARRLITAGELLRMPDDGKRYELILSPNPPMGCVKAGQLGMRDPTREKAWAPLGPM